MKVSNSFFDNLFDTHTHRHTYVCCACVCVCVFVVVKFTHNKSLFLSKIYLCFFSFFFLYFIFLYTICGVLNLNSCMFFKLLFHVNFENNFYIIYLNLFLFVVNYYLLFKPHFVRNYTSYYADYSLLLLYYYYLFICSRKCNRFRVVFTLESFYLFIALCLLLVFKFCVVFFFVFFAQVGRS